MVLALATVLLAMGLGYQIARIEKRVKALEAEGARWPHCIAPCSQWRASASPLAPSVCSTGSPLPLPAASASASSAPSGAGKTTTIKLLTRQRRGRHRAHSALWPAHRARERGGLRPHRHPLGHERPLPSGSPSRRTCGSTPACAAGRGAGSTGCSSAWVWSATEARSSRTAPRGCASGRRCWRRSCTARSWSSWTSPRAAWTRRPARRCTGCSRSCAAPGPRVFLTTHDMAEAEGLLRPPGDPQRGAHRGDGRAGFAYHGARAQPHRGGHAHPAASWSSRRMPQRPMPCATSSPPARWPPSTLTSPTSRRSSSS